MILVLLSHASNKNIHFSEYLNFSKTGKIGVYLFFVLSAYLLDRQILKVLISGNNNYRYWKNYFLRRFLRIYPLFVIALLTYYTLFNFGLKTDIESIKDIIKHIFLLDGKSVFWSIPTEFKYYFLSPIILWFCHRILRWNKALTLIFLLILVSSSTIINNYYSLHRTSTFRYLPVFITGTIISIYEVVYTNDFKITRSKWNNLFAIISLSFIIITIPYYFNKIFRHNINFHLPKFYFIFSLIWGVSLVSIKYSSGIINKVFENKAFRFIGVISYSLYLLHLPIISFVDSLRISNFFKIYAFLFLSILISTTSYLLIELPLSKIRLKSN